MNKSFKNILIPLAMTGGLLTACSDSDDATPAPTSPAPTTPTTPTTPDFDFRTEAPGDYTRVDRSGMPAISTALIASKDSYNESNPTDDIAGTFVPEILNSLSSLHTALDSQLMDLGLSPCTVVGDGSGSCAEFAVPLIIPDTIKLDTNTAAGFPNGRLLSDPVIDVTLAVALLELSGDTPPHAPDALVGVLNPAENDKPFGTEFPFLATPH
ncbi:MAG: DUF4331 family protein [Granulosicoccus sp.]